MKKSEKFRWKTCFFVCCLLLVIKSCGDNQDNRVIYVNNLSVELMNSTPEYLDKYPDYWSVAGTNGKWIYGFGHGFRFQLLKDGDPYEQENIRVDIEVVDIIYPIPGYAHIWEKIGPDGKKYGNIKVFPEAASGWYAEVLHGRTDSHGQLIIAPFVGDPVSTFDPNASPDTRYQLPGPGDSYNDCFSDVVQLRITVPGRHLPLQDVYVWCSFVRHQQANFWESPDCVFAQSQQGIGEFGQYGMQSAGSSETEFPVITLNLPKDYITPKAPKNRSVDYPRVISEEKISATKNYTASSDGITLNSLDLTQLRWDYVEPWGWGWYYFLIQPGEKLTACWMADLKDFNDIAEALNVSEPYAYWATITLPEPFLGNYATSTVHLRAIDANGVRSKIQLRLNLYDKSPDSRTLTFVSDWFLISEDPDFHGYYEDEWGNPYTAFYMPEGTYPDIDFPQNGDFNGDNKIDWQDLGLFSEHWLDSIVKYNLFDKDMSGAVDFNDLNGMIGWWLSDCSPGNEWCNGFDYNQDETVNFRDFAWFASNWMLHMEGTYNYDVIYEEPNNWDGKIDFKDFAAFAENWLKKFN